ncbi:hypothetical protein ACFYOK_29615 [Microbispora bryophytorum]|uniref:hypothetical protein n=1 Tax=Microbispora bryophytorum TaxID=1460882 RepID=UPI0033E60A69
MRVPPLRLVLVPNSEIPFGALASFLTPEVDTWFLDGEQIDERLPEPLSRTAWDIQSRCTFRDTPREQPWGEAALVREDISPNEMRESWKITHSGIYVPVPQHLITARLAAQATAHATEHLRFIEPLP